MKFVSILIQISSAFFAWNSTSTKNSTKYNATVIGSKKQRLSVHNERFIVPKNLKLVFLDRDGVINEDIGDPGVLQKQDLKLTRNAAKSIGNLKRFRGEERVKVVVVTNQSCVGKGLIKQRELDEIHDELQRLLLQEDENAVWDGLYQCTVTREDAKANENEGFRRKPNPGMLLEALKEFNIEAEECILIGDSLRDLEAAARADISMRILVRTGYGNAVLDNGAYTGGEGWIVSQKDCNGCSTFPDIVYPFYVANDLDSAVQTALNQLNKIQ